MSLENTVKTMDKIMENLDDTKDAIEKKDNSKFDEIMDCLDGLISCLRKDENTVLNRFLNGKEKIYFVATTIGDSNMPNVYFHNKTSNIVSVNEEYMKTRPSYGNGTMVFYSDDVVVTKIGEESFIKTLSDITATGQAIIIGTKNSASGKKGGIIRDSTWKVVDSIVDAIKFTDSELVEGEPVYIADVNNDMYDKIIADAQERLNKYIEKKMRKIYMKGDIIITDPCYIVKHLDYSTSPKWSDYHSYRNAKEYPDYIENVGSKQFDEEAKLLDEADKKWRNENPDDWDDFEGAMARAGITSYLYSRTYVGDWSCETVNSDNSEVIGQFCADSGEVGVFLLEDVMKYNPAFTCEDNPHIATIVKDFDGYVNFEVGTDVYDTGIKVIGMGNVNFFTRQKGWSEEDED